MKNISFVHKKGLTLSLTCIFLLVFTFFMAFSCLASELFNKDGDGLPSDFATSFFATENVIWFGSSTSGALSYNKDTSEFKLYSKKDGIIGEVFSVVVGFGKTWIGTDQGLNVIDKDGKMTAIMEIKVADPTKKSGIATKRLREARKVWFRGGYVWVCALSQRGGLFRYDGNNWEEVLFGRASSFNYVSDMIVVGDYIWFGTGGYGLYVLDDLTRAWTIINKSSKTTALIPNNNIKGLAFVKGKVWVATAKAVCVLDQDKNGKITVLEIYDAKNTDKKLRLKSPTSIAATEDGRVFVGTTNGVAVFSDDTWEKLTVTDDDGNEIGISMVFSLGVDGDHLWIGSSQGITRYDL